MLWVVRILRFAMAAVFLYAAYTKLAQSWTLFALSIDSYQLLPAWAVEGIARTLPWTELAIGLLLLSGFLLPWVSAAASLLLTVFFGIMVRSYGKGLTIDCGCFGVGEALGPMTLARDGALLAACVTLTVLAFRVRRSRTA